ncbi:MAG TPA: PQQ-binding-like beta-propeller repeat protein [Gemmataceae bacterium]|jgi:outer membrane protein assembly factor BamB
MYRAALFLSSLALAIAPAWGDNWPQWRGPSGDSVSTETNLPLKWSEKENIRWTCRLPGEGNSTPAIWGDAVFVTAQVGEDLLALKIDRDTGRIVWSRKIGTGIANRKTPDGEKRRHQKFHTLHNLASPSPVTDGEVVVFHFGNGDLAAFDFAGKQLWSHNLQKEYGPYSIWWGHANSPVLYENVVVSVCMQDSLDDLDGPTAESYLIAHDKRTGAVKWKTERRTKAKAEQCDSYTTPLLRKLGDRRELVVMGGNQLDAYEPATGKQLWALPDIVGGRTITGPTVAGDLVYATQGMRGPLLAVRPGAAKDDKPEIIWKQTKGTSDSACPVVWKDLLFWIADNGLAHCCDARTGAVKWENRLPGNYKASPLAADGRIYFLNLAGKCTVIAAASEFKLLAVNDIQGKTLASPAVSDGHIFIRAQTALYCIGTREK